MATGKMQARDGAAPLHELARDPLSVFLFISFTGKELGEIVDDLGISIPGFRTEKLSDAERADAIADEIRAIPSTAKIVIDAVRKIYEFPALDFVALTPEVGAELAALSFEEDAPVRILWRLLSDADAKIRATALPALEQFVKAFYGPLPEGAKGPKAPSKAREGGTDATAEIAKAKKIAERAQEEVAGLKRRADDLKEELRAARAAASEAQKAASAAKKAREAAEKRAAKPLPVAKPGAGAAKQARKELESAKHDLEAAAERARVAEEERDALQAALESAHAKAAAPVAAAASEEEAVEALPATWLLPRFGREFYDSIKGWEPRIVRTAFKQAFLLAENHRHPSLRAIPLEGLPGYYRVRVATDVRLIYRRIEREVEILSVIDREDLDRYVREAKTR